MTDRHMNILNIILYYVLAPLMVLEFLLSDIGVIRFNAILFAVTIVIFLLMALVIAVYKKKHPDYDYKANEMYTRVVFVIIFLECMYSSGVFRP